MTGSQAIALDPWVARALGALLVVLGIALAWALRVALRRSQLRRHRDAQLLRDELVPTAAGTPPPGPPPPDLLVRWVPPLVAVAGVLAGLEVSDLFPIGEVSLTLRQALTEERFSIGDTPVTAMTGLVVVAVLVVGALLSRWVQLALGSALRARGEVDDGAVAAVQRLTHYAVLLLTAVVAFQTAGFDLSALVAASAVFAVGIGFGLQTVFTNFISGLLLLMERSIKPGDLVTVDGVLVRVVDVGIRATLGRTLEDEDLIIPNSKLVEETVIHHSLHEDRVRARALVGVARDSDLDQVQRTLEQAAADVPGRVADRDPVVLLHRFGASSVEFDVSVWVADAWVRPRSLSALRHGVWKALRREGIVVAFPQLDLHLDPATLEAVRGGPPRSARQSRSSS